MQKGLSLLGWRVDDRVTADEFIALEKLAAEALRLKGKGKFTDTIRQDMALQAHSLLDFQIMNVDERALMASGPYLESKHLRESINLIDEAVLCYYRGYYAAALALLFVITEQCLLRICGWTPGSPKPSFRRLTQAPLQLSHRAYRQVALDTLGVIYSRYEKLGDAPFGFNRHAVHHGLRSFSSLDKMNCARAFMLLDTIVFAEGIRRGFAGADVPSRIRKRLDVYRSVVSFGKEMMLIRPGDERLPTR